MYISNDNNQETRWRLALKLKTKKLVKEIVDNGDLRWKFGDQTSVGYSQDVDEMIDEIPHTDFVELNGKIGKFIGVGKRGEPSMRHLAVDS